jgi:hypothetical protein
LLVRATFAGVDRTIHFGLTMAPQIRFLKSLENIPEKERNLGLVVEVPLPGYEDSYKRAANPAIAINESRWKFVSDIHIVLPNIRQLYLFRTLERKHYHYDKDALKKAITDSGLPIILHIHPPDVDLLDNPFVKVINVGFDSATRTIMSDIPLKSIASTLHRETVVPVETALSVPVSPSKKKSKPVLKRQQYHIDVGYTSGQCLIRRDELGISLPVSKTSIDASHTAAMVALSALLKSHVFADLKDTVYFDAVNFDRTATFAEKLAPTNVLEALRSALSNAQNPCGCHDDSHNDPHPNFSTVITFSVFVEIDGVVYRLALIGYSRKAIREYYQSRNKPDAKLVLEINQMLSTWPESRFGWTELVKMINGTHGQNPHPRLGENRFGFIADRCHMNCFRYLSVWIHFASQLITRFSLPYEEAVGLVIGMYCDNNALCFVLVAKDLLQGVDMITGISSLNFGLMIRIRMLEKRKEIRSELGESGFTFPQRFRYCWKDQWMTRMTETKEFEKQKKLVAEKCTIYRERCAVVTHRDLRVAQFV